MNDLLQRIGWGDGHLAQRLGIRLRTVQRWRSGYDRVPPPVLPWLRTIAETIDLLRLPEGWHGHDHPEPQDPPQDTS